MWTPIISRHVYRKFILNRKKVSNSVEIRIMTKSFNRIKKKVCVVESINKNDHSLIYKKMTFKTYSFTQDTATGTSKWREGDLINAIEEVYNSTNNKQ